MARERRREAARDGGRLVKFTARMVDGSPMVAATIATPPSRTERTFASEGLRGGYRNGYGRLTERLARWVRLKLAMKLHQLRYLAAVAQSGLNITAAAQKLHTSQPGVSKQIKLLEDELGFQIFVREGRNLTRITPAGQQVIERALRILQEAQSIRDLSTELRDEGTREPVDRHHPHPGALRAARRDPRVPRALSAGASQPAPGHLGADRRDGGERSHRLRHRHRLRAAVRRPDAPAVLPLAPLGDRAAQPPARERRAAHLQGAGRLSADHLHLQLHRALVAARGLRARRPGAQRRHHRARCGRHRDLRAPRARAWASSRTWRSTRTIRT